MYDNAELIKDLVKNALAQLNADREKKAGYTDLQSFQNFQALVNAYHATGVLSADYTSGAAATDAYAAMSALGFIAWRVIFDDSTTAGDWDAWPLTIATG